MPFSASNRARWLPSPAAESKSKLAASLSCHQAVSHAFIKLRADAKASACCHSLRPKPRLRSTCATRSSSLCRPWSWSPFSDCIVFWWSGQPAYPKVGWQKHLPHASDGAKVRCVTGNGPKKFNFLQPIKDQTNLIVTTNSLIFLLLSL